MGQDFLAAAALVLVLEGVLPFLAPARYRALLAQVLVLEDGTLRRLGLASMLAGLVFLNLVR